ncbi:class I SAM-dependent methyltransferase [Neisseriaceae bacterium B1]
MKTAQIPTLTAEQQTASDALAQYIRDDIQAHDGKIPFSRFMQHALYAPQLGYYTGGAHKIGAAGDFITAPTLTPLFAQTLAHQIAPLLPQTAGNLYEFGAGTGALAADLLLSLSSRNLCKTPDLSAVQSDNIAANADNIEIFSSSREAHREEMCQRWDFAKVSTSLKNYYIIELSAELAQRQQQHIAQHAPEYLDKVIWLNTLPENFDGIIIGNEVLDAMPIERVHRDENGELQQVFVALDNQQFIYQYVDLQDKNLLQAACEYFPDTPDYTSELHPQQYAFIVTLAQKLTRGGIIMIDYGFDAAQYYHPQRNGGTLIGHHRHHSIHDPFYRVGLTDLTAHVNFSDIAAAGCGAGLDLIGYTTQANFLFNLGLLDLLAQNHPQTDTAAYIQAAYAVQQLTAQHEMGELFKVIAFGKAVDVDWQGFLIGDMCHKL